jgi:hypothetical protein
LISEGEVVVFAVGADASIDAVAERVQEVSGGAIETFVLDEGDAALVDEAAAHVPDELIESKPLKQF